jgi:hypothetical protein
MSVVKLQEIRAEDSLGLSIGIINPENLVVDR